MTFARSDVNVSADCVVADFVDVDFMNDDHIGDDSVGDDFMRYWLHDRYTQYYNTVCCMH